MERARDELPAGPVTLRRWADGDADELHRVVCGALAHLAPWMAWAAHGYVDADAREHLWRSREGWADGAESATRSGSRTGGWWGRAR